MLVVLGSIYLSIATANNSWNTPLNLIQLAEYVYIKIYLLPSIKSLSTELVFREAVHLLHNKTVVILWKVRSLLQIQTGVFAAR